MNKFEKLIEYIINDEDQKARELFHDIVVEKSRDIYESIMDEEQVEETIHSQDNVEELSKELDGAEAVGEEEEIGGEEEFALDQDGEEGDEVAGELPADDIGGEEGHDEVVMNIDAKLDELLAKFDEIMGDEGSAEEMPAEVPAEEPAFGGEEEVGAEEEPAMFEGENPFAKGSGKSGSAQSGKSGSAKSGKSGVSGSAKSGKSGKPFESKKSTSEIMREYVDTVGDIYNLSASEGDAVGAAGKKTAVNTKPGSVGPGNDFGGTANMAHGGNQNQDGTSPTKASNEYNKGQGEIKSGNVNVPGGKAGSPESTGKEYTKDAKGAEGQTTDGKVAVAKKSVQVQNTGKK